MWWHQLKQKSPRLLEFKRRVNTSDPFLIYEFYNLLEKTVEELGLHDKPSHIYNMDETGFFWDSKRVKGIVPQGATCYRTTAFYPVELYSDLLLFSKVKTCG